MKTAAMITITMGQSAMANPSSAAVAMLTGAIAQPSAAQTAATTSAPRLAR